MEITICDLCMEEYGDNDKSDKCPRILFCGHTYCTLCLKKIESKNKNIICPTCRTIESRKINELAINRAIYQLIWEKNQKNNNNNINNNINNNNNNNNESLNNNYKYLIKIALIGDSATGKTSLIKSLIEGPLKKEVKYQTTINIDYFAKIIECNNQKINLQIWDTAGTERYQSLTSGYLRGVHGCIIVFDVTKRDSFEKIENWIKTFHYFNNKNNNNNIVIVGNKIDKKERVINKNEAQNFCLQNNFSYFETSALNGENVLNSFQCLAKKNFKF